MKLSKNMQTTIFLFFLVGISVFLRLVLLDQSFWLDEAAQVLESMRPFSQQLQIAYDFQPPLFHLIVHAFTYVSLEEWWLRVSSVFAGVATVIFTWLLGKELCKEEKQVRFVPELASLLLATSSFHVYYSQELRPYAFSALFGTISWYFLLKYIRKSSKLTTTLFVISTVLGMYTMYVYGFLFLSQLLFLVWKKRMKFAVFSSMVVGVFFLPWLPFFLEQLGIGRALQTQLPGWDKVVSDPQWKVLLLVWFRFVGGVKTFDTTLTDSAYFGIPGIVVIAAALNLAKNYKKHVSVLEPLVFWLGSILLAWVCSFFIPVISAKRVLFALPAFYLICSYLLLHAFVHIRKVLFLAIGVYQIWNVTLYWTNPLYQREDWRAAILSIQKNFSPYDAALVFEDDAPFAPWQFYSIKFGLKYTTFSSASGHVVTKQSIEGNMLPALNYKKLLVFEYLKDLTDPAGYTQEWLKMHGYSENQQIDGKRIGFIRVFQKELQYADALGN